MLVTQEERTEGIKRQAQELIDQAYQRGYKAGREDKQDWEKDQADRLIEHGMNIAWEAARKIVHNEHDVPFAEWNLNMGQCTLEVFNKYTASEAIEKLKVWEQKQEQKSKPQEFNSCDECIHVYDSKAKCVERGCVHAIKTKDCFEKRQNSAEIRVGDEVIRKESIQYNNKKYIVTYIGIEEFEGLDENGQVNGRLLLKFFKKTGKHYDEIEQILAKMREKK